MADDTAYVVGPRFAITGGSSGLWLRRAEGLSLRLAGITGSPTPTTADKAAIVMAGDHGVAAKGVSAYPQEVTAQMVLNFLGGGAAINVLSQHAGARVVVVDMGVAGTLAPHNDLISRKIGPGTGDMGIGNTTASSAICACITGYPVEQVTGRGTGVDDIQLQHKKEVIEKPLAVNRPVPDDPLDVLGKVGGHEIGGLAGVILGAAAHRIPVVVDGFISGAAALIAAGRTAAQRLEIMRDSRAGAFGVAGAFSILLIKYVSLSELPSDLRAEALLIATYII